MDAKHLIAALFLGLLLTLVLGLSITSTQAAPAVPGGESAVTGPAAEPTSPGDLATLHRASAATSPFLGAEGDGTSLPPGAADVPGVTPNWWSAVRSEVQRYSPPRTLQDTTADWIAIGESDNDRFGWSVASAGDVNGDGYADVVVGAPYYSSGNHQGAAYVYYGSASGLSTTAAVSLTGENDGDNFGASVASAGDVNGDGYADLVVGAFGHNANQGAAYVYHGSTSGLSTTAAVSLTGETASDLFGVSVASAGDVNGDGYADVVVGAHGYDGYRGKAYVYHGSATGLSATAAVSLTGENSVDAFGWPVASAGDVNGDGYADLVVGAQGYDVPLMGNDQGAAYVYYGSASGLSATAAVSMTGENTGDNFGVSVASAGDVNGDGYADLAVGALGYNAGTNQGAVYVYHGSAGGLSASATVSLTGETAGDHFGVSVGTAGDVNGDGYADLVVGAQDHSSSQGAAYVYHGSALGLVLTPDVSLTGETAGDSFGVSVASAGDVNGDGYADLVVGAFGYNANQGAAYVYHGGGEPLSTAAAWTTTGENNDEYLGYSAASAGDVNGDGYADVVVGALGHNANQGVVYVYHGSAFGLSTTAAVSMTGETAGDSFGVSVASAGDVNGDGYADVVVGAHGYDGYRGKAYVYHGSASGLSATAAVSMTGESDGDYFGLSVGTAGDVNGDGYADLVVGARGYGTNRGAAYVYHGSALGLTTTPTLTLTGEGTGDYFGQSVASAGDVNGDGYADVIVGAFYYGSLDQGRAYVYHGSTLGLVATPALTLTGENTDDRFGFSVGTAGDVNGDGYADAIVGAFRYGGARGATYVYYGSDLGLVATPALTLTGENYWDYFGISVASAGDVNGDGYADVVVGAWDYPAAACTGAAYVYHGSPFGLSTTAATSMIGENNEDFFGGSVAGAGDVNGDGYADVVVGAFGYPNRDLRGKAYVYHGNDGGGRTVLARQARGDGSGTPVQSWGLSYAGDGFQVQLRATDPRGRGRVKLQVEACPPGTAFADAACTTCTAATWTDVTTATPGVTLTEIITGLSADTLYRWRAQVLYAPYTVDQAGITPPPNPAHGPWRRWLGQAVEADVRTYGPNWPQFWLYLPLGYKDY